MDGSVNVCLLLLVTKAAGITVVSLDSHRAIKWKYDVQNLDSSLYRTCFN